MLAVVVDFGLAVLGSQICARTMACRVGWRRMNDGQDPGSRPSQPLVRDSQCGQGCGGRAEGDPGRKDGVRAREIAQVAPGLDDLVNTRQDLLAPLACDPGDDGASRPRVVACYLAIELALTLVPSGVPSMIARTRGACVSRGHSASAPRSDVQQSQRSASTVICARSKSLVTVPESVKAFTRSVREASCSPMSRAPSGHSRNSAGTRLRRERSTGRSSTELTRPC